MADPEALADAEARQAVAAMLDANLFVEAGAGSGKTTSLVDRVVTLVTKGGVEVGDIAAITFTEAAARELRSRVREQLVVHGVDGADVEAATFTTLHSFALRILLNHPVESGLPPGFAVLDEVRSVLDFERGWKDFLGRLGDDMALLELQQRAAVFDPKLTDRLSAVARSFDENWDRIDAIRSAIGSDRTDDDLWSAARPVLSPLDLSRELEAVAGLASHLDGCISSEDKLVVRIRQLMADVEALRHLEPVDQLRGLVGLRVSGLKNVGQKGNWRSPSVDEMRQLAAEAVATVKGGVDRYRQEMLAGMTDLVAVHIATEVRGRHRSGLVSFHDLLVLAKLLVRSNESVRRRLHDRYQRILLDEFQDTDPLQIELAATIAAGEQPGDRPWYEVLGDLEPGRLTVVGDPKQSIYRFRRADMGVYLRTGRALQAGNVELSTNFRSVPGIIDFVNEFFDRRFQSDADDDSTDPGKRQPPYRRLVAKRDNGPDGTGSQGGRGPDHPVVVLGQPYDKDETNAERLRDFEAADIAALVCKMVDEQWPVHRGDLGRWGDVRLQDIAILIPSRLSLPSLETAFQEFNIPIRPETNSLVYATQEIRDVMAAVRAVVDPGSSIDVVASLRSALFAVDDQALLKWKLAGGSWDYRDPPPPGLEDSEISQAFGVLAQWRSTRWWIEPAHLVDQVVQERRLRELSLLHARPRDRLRRYRFLAEQARLFSETEGGDLQDFVDWVEIQASDLARITEPVPPEPDDDAVRVLTVHGAKGLEFPIAVMAGAPTDVSGSRPASVLYGDELPASDGDGDGDGDNSIGGEAGPNTEIRLTVDNQTEGFDARASVERVLDAQERIRLQYVAATRARDYLIVCTHHNDRRRSVGRETWEVLQEIPGTWTTVELDHETTFRDEPAQLRLPEGDFAKAQASWVREQDRILDRSGESTRWSATAVAAHLASEVEDYSSGGLGPDFGTAVHNALELLPFNEPDTGGAGQMHSLELLAETCAQQAGVPALSHEVANRLNQAMGTDVVRLATQSRHWRELTVSLAWPGGSFDGVIDLVVETPDGLVVVDYKTDYLRPESLVADLEAKIARYRFQIAAYAVAVERLLPDSTVAEGRLLFLGEDGIHDCVIPDLASAKADVVALLESDTVPTPGE